MYPWTQLGISAVAPFRDIPSHQPLLPPSSPHATTTYQQRPSFNMPATRSTASTTRSGCKRSPTRKRTTSSAGAGATKAKKARVDSDDEGEEQKGKVRGKVKGEGKGTGKGGKGKKTR